MGASVLYVMSSESGEVPVGKQVEDVVEEQLRGTEEVCLECPVYTIYIML